MLGRADLEAQLAKRGDLVIEVWPAEARLIHHHPASVATEPTSGERSAAVG
jgi:hypothetical protein